MPITIPHDLADELAEASHWYPGLPEMEVFLGYVRKVKPNSLVVACRRPKWGNLSGSRRQG
jgi:hypothetical protein